MTEREDLVWTLVHAVVLALLYVLTGHLSFALFQQDSVVTVTIFIPEGIALAAVLIYGYRVVPGIFVGQLLLALSSGLAWEPAVGISLSNAAEAIIAYKLFHYFKLDKSLAHIRDLIGLFLLILLALQPLSALMGNGILFFAGVTPQAASFENIFFWWFGNAMGQLLIAPMLLIFYARQLQINYRVLALTVLVFALLNYAVQVLWGVSNVSLLLVATLPFAIYLSTVDLPAATLGTLTLVLTSLYYYHVGIGTFVSSADSSSSLIDLNVFILNHIILVLIIGVLFREKNAAIASLRSMAHYDRLTGLPNRHLLNETLNHSLYLCEQYGRESMICFMDLDGFKRVNDTYGHATGDRLLKEVARRIKNTLRPTDAMLRLGGDEFLLVLNDSGYEGAQARLTRVQHAVRTIEYIGNHRVAVSASIGVANCPRDGLKPDDLIDASDQAMYQAKKAGKDTIVYATNSLSDP